MIREFPSRTVRANELLGDLWFNGDPVPVLGQRGNVVLLAFWDFSCDASLRALPYWKEWVRKYAPYGLVAVGVHTPRFAFGRDAGAVQRALARLDVTFPVVMDNESGIWSRYGIRDWPSVALVDRDGFVRSITEGDGQYPQIERMLQSLMLEARLLQETPDLVHLRRDTSGVVRPVPPVLAGYVRGSIGNTEGMVPESLTRYTDPGIYVDGRMYLEGDWLPARESVEFRPAPGGSGLVVVPYAALGASAVMQSSGTRPVDVTVRQDGSYVGKGEAGDDLRHDAAGRSHVVVREPRLYSLVRNPEHSSHHLVLVPLDGGLVLYAVSFEAGAVTETMSSN